MLAPRLADLLHARGLNRRCAAVQIGRSPHADALLAQLKPESVVHAVDELHDGPAAAPRDDDHAPRFVRGLGWIGVLYGAAKASTLVTQILAGRWLGPEEYGRANLAMAAAAYLQIAPMLGFPVAMSKFLAAETDERRRERFVSTALAAFGLWTLLCLPAMAAAHRALENLLGVPSSLFASSMALAVANAVYVVVASPLLGLKRFAYRGLVETVYGLAVPLALVAALAVVGPSSDALVAALSAGFALGALYALWCQRRYLVAAFEPAVLGQVWRYASVAALNMLASACVLAPARFVLHATRGAQEVGLFSAYFTATVQVSMALLYMLQSVIVPLASDARGQRETWELLRRRALPAIAAAWALFLAGLVVVLAVFGKRYPLRWDWALAFSASAALVLAHGAVSALYSARDFAGLRVSVSGGLIAGLGNAALAAWLVPRYGVTGAAAALAVSFALGLSFFGVVRAAEAA